MDIRAGDYDDVADCALVIVTAGAGQKPGETRLDLVHKNVAIFRSIIPEIARRNRDAILLIVSNPVDVLTWAAWKLSGYPANRVLGSGTVLDTARLKYLLRERLGVDSRSVHASSSASTGTASWRCGAAPTSPAWTWTTSASCGERKITAPSWTASTTRCGTAPMRSSSARGPPTTASHGGGPHRRVYRKNESAMLPISAVLEGEYGLKNLCLSIPAIVGQDGVETVLEIPLAPQEKSALLSSAQQLQEVIGHLELP